MTAPATEGTTRGGIHYAVHGPAHGRPLLLGFPLMASYTDVFGRANAPVLRGYLDRLTDRYRVLLLDYPSIGRSAPIPPEALTADRVCADLLEAADAARFEHFAYCGWLWGAVVGLLLASRSARVSALVCGGWPPLGAQYVDMLRGGRLNLPAPPSHALVVLRGPAQYRQWVTFYESIQDWPEAEAVARIRCPRMVLIGADAVSDVAGIPLTLAATVRARRAELERLGWLVVELPGQGAAVMLDPAVAVPPLRAFLDAAAAPAA